MKQLFLIGFMGCGKSTLGKSLARKTGYTFLDLDEKIEQGEGRMIKEIFLHSGEDYFREIERGYLLRCLGLDKTVVAVGGGAPCYLDNIELMNASGTTVYIDVPPYVLLQRLKKDKKNRPLIETMEENELSDFISLNLKKREVFYLKAVLHIHDPQTGIDEILRYM